QLVFPYFIRFLFYLFFFFTDPATTEIYTLSLHDALPISRASRRVGSGVSGASALGLLQNLPRGGAQSGADPLERRELQILKESRSEEHTSELQSLAYLVCRLLLEKKKKIQIHTTKLDSVK